VPPDDPAAVADALLRIYRDPELARRLGREAEATVRARFDGEHLAAELATLFREVTA
jgi:glycosyltransferase involved in cell wall biosynthesis